jgi:hypothetical protein
MPEPFTRLLEDRAIIDRYQAEHHRVEAGIAPVPNTSMPARNNNPRFVRVVRAQTREDVLQYRTALPERFLPVRGFRAPILDRAREQTAAALPTNVLSAAQRKAADCVAQRLAPDGLLVSLARVLEILGPAQFTNGPALLEAVEKVGFPVDLLASFPLEQNGMLTNDSFAVVARVALKLANGATPESLAAEFATWPFRFARARPEFEVATESGENELGLLRMQAGGGYRGGVVPGDSLDIIGQLVAALPRADFLISIPNEMLEPFQQMVTLGWRLRRPNHLTIVGEPLTVAAWAQDNGKAGVISADSAGGKKLATLAPRYASIDEGQSVCEAGESFLMDGLKAAGHSVVHSSLLFQGGNLMAARDPKSGERVLLLGESASYRNVTLGLTPAQTLEAFKTELGVDRCVVLPIVSYHIDFDVCLRARDGEMIAFVNDTMSAARIVASIGLEALERHGALDSNAAQTVRSDFSAGRDLEAVRRLNGALQRQIQGRRDFPASISKHFVADKVDSAAGNLQCFLLALDLIESARAGDDLGAMDPERREYLLALRRLDGARQKQIEELKKLGWSIIPVPSMPDLYRGINYLNGIQHRDGYVMPVFGGFYTRLDQAALAVFRQALGPELRITLAQSAESQRKHGGVHCAAAAYPRL